MNESQARNIALATLDGDQTLALVMIDRASIPRYEVVERVLSAAIGKINPAVKIYNIDQAPTDPRDVHNYTINTRSSLMERDERGVMFCEGYRGVSGHSMWPMRHADRIINVTSTNYAVAKNRAGSSSVFDIDEAYRSELRPIPGGGIGVEMHQFAQAVASVGVPPSLLEYRGLPSYGAPPAMRDYLNKHTKIKHMLNVAYYSSVDAMLCSQMRRFDDAWIAWRIYRRKPSRRRRQRLIMVVARRLDKTVSVARKFVARAIRNPKLFKEQVKFGILSIGEKTATQLLDYVEKLPSMVDVGLIDEQSAIKTIADQLKANPLPDTPVFTAAQENPLHTREGYKPMSLSEVAAYTEEKRQESAESGVPVITTDQCAAPSLRTGIKILDDFVAEGVDRESIADISGNTDITGVRSTMNMRDIAKSNQIIIDLENNP